jgi:ribosomal protein S18 acetylase RimI-like enzyme
MCQALAVKVRPATEDDSPAVRHVLHRALSDDPFVRWLARGQPKAIDSYFALMLERIALPKGVVHVVDVAGELASVALWAPPHTFELTVGESLRMLPTMVSVIGAFRFTRVAAILDEVEAARPPEPRWLLTLLGTLPERRGRGLASAVLAPVLERCDREGACTVCETSAPENLTFYGRHGFEVVGERALGADGPPSWTLRREPVSRRGSR